MKVGNWYSESRTNLAGYDQTYRKCQTKVEKIGSPALTEQMTKIESCCDRISCSYDKVRLQFI